MVNLKKLSLLLVLCFTMINISFGATQVISQCPTSFTNDTEYILTDSFFFDKATCFDFDGLTLENIVINGNFTEFEDTGSSTLLFDTGQNCDLQGIEIKNFSIANMGSTTFYRDSREEADVVYNINLHHNKILNSSSNFIRFGITSGTSLGNGQMYYNGTFNIDNNYFESLYPFLRIDYARNYDGSNYLNFNDLVIRNNDVIYGGLYSYSTGGFLGRGQANYYSWTIAGQWLFENNNFVGSGKMFLVEPTLTGTYYFSNNFDGSLSVSLDVDAPFGETDADVTRTSANSVVYSNTEEPTVSISKSGLIDYKEGYISMGLPVPWVNLIANLGTGNTLDNWKIYISKPLTIDGTNTQIYFDGFIDSTLDLSNLRRQTGLTLTNTRAIKMGSNNVLYGGNDATYKADITTSGTISISDAGYYNNNWHLIEFDNNLKIEGVQFNLNAVDDYGLVRKRDTNADGINFEFINNYVDYNFVPNSPVNRPQFLVGAMIIAKDNVFDLPSTVNISLFGGGQSGNIAGGHYFINNQFTGGGHIFRLLADFISGGGTNYPSYFIHNEFKQLGSIYALPFDPSVISSNLLINPNLNGSYYHITPCTNYEFNIGNWYEDWADSGWYNDSNSDGIHDSYNGIDYILRGYDFQDNEIKDFRSVTPYPFDFDGNIGTALAVYDTCLSFVFNINTPVDETNYTTGQDITTDWEFISTGYSDLYCFEKINDNIVIYEGVNSGENQGSVYELTDGEGVYSVKCCDNVQCNNIVKESDPINFCVGNCDLGLLSVTSVEEPPTIIYGCTDSSATNYNPSATNDDGSCTYPSTGDGNDPITSGDIGGIFSSDFENSGDTVAGLFNLASEPLQFTMIIGFIFLFLALLSLLFAGLMYLIG